MERVYGTIASYRQGEFSSRGGFNVGDVDGNDFSDIASMSAEPDQKIYYCRLLSGKDGALLMNIKPSQSGPRFGFRGVSLGDFNDDGIAEIAVADTRIADDYLGQVFVISIGSAPVPPESVAELMVRRNGDQMLLTWPATLEEAMLESSRDLNEWTPVEDMHLANFYEVPESEDAKNRYYRLRHRLGE
jgi:hypothetical protein